ncbi:bcl-2/adenovirus E1B 19 kDa-interacting protein 2-like protein isoform X1 [Periophthalmus magnuspinnatus]|uniref:bcl-2/adenovirus E1B 19 kDa-interacting protein 2-like protein isoform X1 n=1 Tax=Periophthalmus magnuspinnatus TaxID=409849 RepID=UPI0024371904|nr:bcl-2/adenovirus E1B 19 kDa-interacting protein 2-like protein isoform X1 [Periophthalmus magnuspinnatus]
MATAAAPPTPTTQATAEEELGGPTDDMKDKPTRAEGGAGEGAEGGAGEGAEGGAGEGAEGGEGEEGGAGDGALSERPAPPSSLQLSNKGKKKVLSAPALSLSLGGGSVVSDDLSKVLSPSVDEVDEVDLDLEALETPSDSESLVFPHDLDLDLDLEEDMRRLGVASSRGPSSLHDPSLLHDPSPSRRRSLGLEPEDTVDSVGRRWRSFTSSGFKTQVNMSLIQDYVRVISHGGYYGDEENDIIVFSSCFLPENSIDSYEEVMYHLFKYVMGTLELMVSQDYVVVYLCAGAQKNQVPGLGWLRDCYTTIDRRLRKNLKGFYVVHPTWFIKALITIVKPFISSKFSRKLRFVNSLQELSELVPTEQAQIPACVKEEHNYSATVTPTCTLQSWFSPGSVLVQSWFSPGSVLVQSWFSPGSVLHTERRQDNNSATVVVYLNILKHLIFQLILS